MYLFLCILTYVPSCCLVFSLFACRNIPFLFVFCVLLGVPKNAQFRRIMWRSFIFCDFCCTHTLVPSYMIRLISTGRYPLAAVSCMFLYMHMHTCHVLSVWFPCCDMMLQFWSSPFFCVLGNVSVHVLYT